MAYIVYCQDRQSKQENPDKIMLQGVTMPNYPS